MKDIWKDQADGMPEGRKGEDMQELQKDYEVRYVFEHRLLPAWFYCAGEETLKGIQDQDAAFLWRKWKLLCGAAGLEMTDAKNPFKVSKRTIDDRCAIVRIDMPNPDGQALCYYVYLIWSGDYESRGYFTVERGASPKVRYLCSWTEGRQHCNHGKCSPHAAGVEKKIANLFAGRSSGIREKLGRLFPPVPERPHRGGDCPVYGTVEEMLDSARQYASEQNYAEAIKLWSMAAEQGDARAQYSLGMCYHEGDGVAQDYAEACRWHRKAAEQGHAAAQFTLGLWHAFGDGVKEDPSEAYQWCRKAAEQGLADAQYFLGYCFFMETA